MNEIIHALCAITATLCAILLLRAFAATRTKLLFWSGLCFVGLAITNGLLVVDTYVYPQIDLVTPRLWIALGALVLMLYGLIYSDD